MLLHQKDNEYKNQFQSEISFLYIILIIMGFMCLFLAIGYFCIKIDEKQTIDNDEKLIPTKP